MRFRPQFIAIVFGLALISKKTYAESAFESCDKGRKMLKIGGFYISASSIFNEWECQGVTFGFIKNVFEAYEQQ